ncbi:MAG: hypothetical protein LUC83_07250 [Clostridiales bacterium]|nr:hypothetical protein [Clostridiales bacterium]
MFEEYYREPEPAKRKKILYAYQPGDFDGEKLAQMKKLFEIRYTQDKKGVWADSYLRSLLELRMVADDMGSSFSSRRNRKMGTEAVRRFCLDRGDEFEEEILYRELCHLIALYISDCNKDKNYNSVIWGFGKRSEEKIRGKITYDLLQVSEEIPKYLDMEEECRLLTAAIKAMSEKMLDY